MSWTNATAGHIALFFFVFFSFFSFFLSLFLTHSLSLTCKLYFPFVLSFCSLIYLHSYRSVIISLQTHNLLQIHIHTNTNTSVRLVNVWLLFSPYLDCKRIALLRQRSRDNRCEYNWTYLFENVARHNLVLLCLFFFIPDNLTVLSSI